MERNKHASSAYSRRNAATVKGSEADSDARCQIDPHQQFDELAEI